MTQRKAKLTCMLSVAFLISACLSIAQATEVLGRDGFGVEAAAPQLLQQNCSIDQDSLLNRPADAGVDHGSRAL